MTARSGYAPRRARLGRGHAVDARRCGQCRSRSRARANGRGAPAADGHLRSVYRHAIRENSRPRLPRTGEQGSGALPQYLGQRIAKLSWLGQLADMILGTPSLTSAHSSRTRSSKTLGPQGGSHGLAHREGSGTSPQETMPAGRVRLRHVRLTRKTGQPPRQAWRKAARLNFAQSIPIRDADDSNGKRARAW